MNFTTKLAVIGFTLFLSHACWANATRPSTCHPEVDPSAPQYLVGYGSLIQTKSKNKTYPNTGENIPVNVSGFERSWNANGINVHTTFLGVTRNEKTKFNGVIFQVPSAEVIQYFDDRETSYCRVKIFPSELEILNKTAIPNGQFWIYVPIPCATSLPSQDFPISQSYVDIFLSGCLEIQTKHHLTSYTGNCIDTTINWSTHWINDRKKNPSRNPSQDIMKEINNLLETKLPLLFNEIEPKE